MKIIILLIGLILFPQLGVKAQSMKVEKVEKKIGEVVNCFQEKSFEDFQSLLLNKNDLLELVESISDIGDFDSEIFDKKFNSLNKEIEGHFKAILKKGEDKGINWAYIIFDGFVYNTEELIIGEIIKPQGYLIDCHIRLKYVERNFTIIGIQLWLFDDGYKIKGDELAGIFEIDLDIYVPTEDMYLDEMEESGY